MRRRGEGRSQSAGVAASTSFFLMSISDKLATDCGKILPRICANILLHMIAEGGRSGDDRKAANKRTTTCVPLTNDAKWSGCKGVRGTAHPFASGWSGHGAHVLFHFKANSAKTYNRLTRFRRKSRARKLPIEGIY